MKVCEINHRGTGIAVFTSDNLKMKVQHIMMSIILFTILFLSSAGRAGSQTTLSTPAEFIRELSLPGIDNDFLRPGRVLVDNTFGEIYVADPGHSRVIIFDQNGTFLYEFITAEQCGSPSDLAIDSQGMIYVLGTTLQGKKIFVYDFDGRFIRLFDPDFPEHNDSTVISSIAISGEDKLYALDKSTPRIICFDLDGNYESEIPIMEGLDESNQHEIVFGTISIKDDIIYLPVSSMGTVKRFNVDGEKLRSLGYRGSGIGELSFPVSVAVTNEDIVLILDKHRYNVVSFSNSGQFLGEFGGKGLRVGWFYHPTWLAVSPNNELLITQVYNNMVQVCRLPQFIVDRHLNIHSNNTHREVDSQQTTGGDIFNSLLQSELSFYTPMEPGRQSFTYTFYSVYGQVSDLPTNHFKALKEVH